MFTTQGQVVVFDPFFVAVFWVPLIHLFGQDLDRVFPHCFGQARAEHLGKQGIPRLTDADLDPPRGCQMDGKGCH